MDIDPTQHASNSSNGGSQNRKGGGVFIAIGAIVGVLAGGYFGQPSVGLLVGLAAGVIAALAIWYKSRGG